MESDKIRTEIKEAKKRIADLERSLEEAILDEQEVKRPVYQTETGQLINQETFEKGDIFYAVVPSWDQNDLEKPERLRPPNIHSVRSGIAFDVTGDYVLAANEEATKSMPTLATVMALANHELQSYAIASCFRTRDDAEQECERLNNVNSLGEE